MHTTVLSLLALAGAAHSHMSLFYPPPLGGAPSINKQSTELDPEFNFPLGCCGSDGGDSRPSPGICRGHLDKYDTETAQVTWQPGQDAYFQLTDFSYDPNAPGGTHYGGSCQVGFSLDRGETWKMAASYHGACPYHTEDGSPEAQTFDFKVPTGMPKGDALFAWVWLNREHEAFSSCARVNIGGSSDDSDPSTTPSKPSQSISQPEDPVQSATQPEAPENDGSEPEAPATTSRVGGRPPQEGAATVTTTVATTIYVTEPTGSPEEGKNDGDSEEGTEQTEDSENNWWHNRPHRKVQQGTRRYQVDGARCDCRRDEITLAARCSCDSPDNAVQRKALRLHRRTFYKRVDACSWDSAPAMEVSYYTIDAKCAPNAKQDTPESDTFEIKWDVSCGVVEADNEYPLKTMVCGNSFAASIQ